MTNEEFIKSISLEGEVWKDIPGYENEYQISSFGRVYSKQRIVINSLNRKFTVNGRLLIPDYSAGGYVYVNLSKNNKHKKELIHRIVALTFINNPNNNKFVDHIDGNRTNNTVSNLRWVTASENMNNINTCKKLQATNTFIGKPVVKLKNNKLCKIYPYQQATKEDGFSPTNIATCCKKLTDMYGYTWMYYDEYNKLLEKDQSLN